MVLSTAGFIAAVIGISTSIALLIWTYARYLRSSRREAWVALDIHPDDPEPPAETDEPVAPANIDGADDLDAHVEAPTESDPEPADQSVDDPPDLDARPRLPDAVLDDDGDLLANGAIVAVIDPAGSVVALSRPARTVLGWDRGSPYASLGWFRPVGSAEVFDDADHPVARALSGGIVDRLPCLLETAAGNWAGLVTAQPVEVDGDGMALLLIEVAPD